MYLKRIFKSIIKKPYMLAVNFCNVKNWQKTEVLLIITVLLAMGCGLFAQIVLANDSLSEKIYLGENWYGSEYETASLENKDNKIWGNVVLELADYTTLPKARVLINGEEAGRFTEKTVTVRVENGDLLAVDTKAYNCPVKVVVLKVSSVIDKESLFEESLICGYREIGRIKIC